VQRAQVEKTPNLYDLGGPLRLRVEIERWVGWIVVKNRQIACPVQSCAVYLNAEAAETRGGSS
jgi:hypothetical protein